MKKYGAAVVRASRFFAVAMNLTMATTILGQWLPEAAKPLLIVTNALACFFYTILRAAVVTIFSASVWSASSMLTRLFIWLPVPVTAVLASIVDPRLVGVSMIIAAIVMAINLIDWRVDRKRRRAPDHIPTDW